LIERGVDVRDVCPTRTADWSTKLSPREWCTSGR
jgi:hypothetical protein